MIIEHSIRLFTVNTRSGLANLDDLEWAKTEVTGVEHGDWHGVPCLRLNVPSDRHREYVLVCALADEERVRTQAIPLIEKYRRQYRQEVWADRLR